MFGSPPNQEPCDFTFKVCSWQCLSQRHLWQAQASSHRKKTAGLAQAIPNWLTTVLLAILLTMLTWKLSARGILTWRKETADAQQQCDSEAAQPLLQDERGDPSTHSHEALNEAFHSNGPLPGLRTQTAAHLSQCS